MYVRLEGAVACLVLFFTVESQTSVGSSVAVVDIAAQLVNMSCCSQFCHVESLPAALNSASDKPGTPGKILLTSDLNLSPNIRTQKYDIMTHGGKEASKSIE